MAKMNKTAITAITLSAILGAGSIGGLAYSRYLGAHKTATPTTYTANDDAETTTLNTADVLSATKAAKDAEDAAKSALQAQQAAEKALEQAKTERAAAEKAAQKATAEEKATAQKVAEQKAAAEKAAQQKAADAKKVAQQKAAEQKKAQEAKAAAEKKAAEQKKAQEAKAAAEKKAAEQKKAQEAKAAAEKKAAEKKAAEKKAAEEKKAKKAVINWSASYYFATSNAITVNHYTDGRLVAENGVEYKDNGNGTLTGTDGTTLFSTEEAADAYAREEADKANPIDWSANYYYINSNSVQINHYKDGRLVDANGIEYTDNGNGTLTGTDGSTLFSTKEAADQAAKEEYEKANPVDWSANYFYATSNSIKVDHYRDGRFIAENGVEYTDNNDGTLTGTDGTKLFSTEGAADEYLREQKEAADQAAQEEAQRQAEEEAQRQAEEEAQRQAEEEAQKQAEEEAQRQAEEEAQRQAEEEAQRQAEEEAQRQAEEQAEQQAEEQAEQQAEEEAEQQAEEEAEQQDQQTAQDDSAKAAVRSAVANALADGELSDEDIANISSVAGGVSFTASEIASMGLTTGQAQSMGICICG